VAVVLLAMLAVVQLIGLGDLGSEADAARIEAKRQVDSQ
jgi:hypothetical protein